MGKLDACKVRKTPWNLHLCAAGNMAIITLTTDFGSNDHYVGSVKGKILSEQPDARIVDITHHVSPFDTVEAAYHLRCAYSNFPKGTVHLVGVNAHLSDETPHRIAVYEGQYFIAADGGIFSLLFDKEPDAVYTINLPSDSDVLTFPVLHILTKAAGHILRGGTPEVIARRSDEIRKAPRMRPMVDNDSIRGSVVYIDRFGNLVTNIDRSLFKEVGKGRGVTIHLRTDKHMIRKISSHYKDVVEGEVVALFNTASRLEIGINGGSLETGGGADRLFGLKKGDLILCLFNDR